MSTWASGCAEERDSHVGFADQTDAHGSTPSACSLLFFRGNDVVVSLDLCDGDVEFWKFVSSPSKSMLRQTRWHRWTTTRQI